MNLEELLELAQMMVDEPQVDGLQLSRLMQAEIEVRAAGDTFGQDQTFQVIGVGWQNGKVVLGVA